MESVRRRLFILYIFFMNDIAQKEILEGIHSLGSRVDKQLEENLEAIHSLASHVDKRFEENTEALQALATHVDKQLEENLEAIHELATHVDKRFDDVRVEFTQVRSEMGSMGKHLEDKIDDSMEEAGLKIRKEDVKVDGVIRKLKQKKVFTAEDVRELSTIRSS